MIRVSSISTSFPVGNFADAKKETKQAEEALRSSEAWFSRTLRSIGDAVIATDGKAYVKLINPVAQALTGWNEKDAIGKPLAMIREIPLVPFWFSGM